MWKKMKKPGRNVFLAAGAVFVLALALAGFTGCRDQGAGEEKIRDLDFSVAAEKDVPSGLQEIISQKREKPFKLTYADGEDMYIVIGEGPQKGGGYSVAVKELYLTDNSIVIRTELIGPQKGEASGTDTSYPVLLVKTEYLDEPVVFQ